MRISSNAGSYNPCGDNWSLVTAINVGIKLEPALPVLEVVGSDHEVLLLIRSLVQHIIVKHGFRLKPVMAENLHEAQVVRDVPDDYLLELVFEPFIEKQVEHLGTETITPVLRMDHQLHLGGMGPVKPLSVERTFRDDLFLANSHELDHLLVIRVHEPVFERFPLRNVVFINNEVFSGYSRKKLLNEFPVLLKKRPDNNTCFYL